MFYPYIAEMNEILTYSDVFIEPFEFDVEIKILIRIKHCQL